MKSRRLAIKELAGLDKVVRYFSFEPGYRSGSVTDLLPSKAITLSWSAIAFRFVIGTLALVPSV